MTDPVVVTAPANVLLLGEYAVLEEGGLGLAIAVDVRAVARSFARAAGDPTIVTGSLPGTTVRWPGDEGILGSISGQLAGRFGIPNAGIAVDTARFFDADGRKRGYGSSAAVTVVLSTAWSLLVGRPFGGDGERDAIDAIDAIDWSIRAHRTAQGGRGSGYDVATSVLGGCVLFSGGERPTARRVALDWLPPMGLFAGREPVSSRSAVGAYERWKSKNPSAAGDFLNASNAAVLAFARARSWTEAEPALRSARLLGEELGRSIGVDATIDVSCLPSALPTGAIVKAVGAGNELGVAFPDPDGRVPTHPGDLEPLVLAQEGVRCE